MNIAVLNPGAMGISVAAALQSTGNAVFWMRQNRSEETRARAKTLQLAALDKDCTLADMQAIVSVCPPHAAVELAWMVKQSGFAGIYVDANAVAPQTAAKIAEIFGEHYVDGGIIGPPANVRGSTRLYLSGKQAHLVASWFEDSLLRAICVSEDCSSASALKMCYAAYTKGLSAMLLDIRALARQLDVEAPLLDEWAISQQGLAQRSEAMAIGVAGKAWRFSGEMHQIAHTFESARLPNGFHTAAAEIYERMAELKTRPDAQLEEVLSSILDKAQ